MKAIGQAAKELVEQQDRWLNTESQVAVLYFHNKEQHEHAKTVAQNRGIFNIAYFQNLEEGIAWLTTKG